LGAHVFGEHLGQWQTGIDWLLELERRSTPDADGDAAVSLRRSIAVLRLAAGESDRPDSENPSERVRIRAMAASTLAGRGELELAPGYFELALAEVEALAPDDPAHRAVAVTANNLAQTLEEKPARTAGETELMLRAARAARKLWEIAGTWVHVGRAEYRLAKSHLVAGHIDLARSHAQQCLSLCQTNAAPALELFWAHEALASVARAADDPEAVQSHMAAMTHHLGAVDDSVRPWCEQGLSRLVAG
jgi:hypothetical protein